MTILQSNHHHISTITSIVPIIQQSSHQDNSIVGTMDQAVNDTTSSSLPACYNYNVKQQPEVLQQQQQQAQHEQLMSYDIELVTDLMDIPLSINEIHIGEHHCSKQHNYRPSFTTTVTQCKGIFHAILSRSFYSLASISMILMNRSIDISYHHYTDGDLSILCIIFQSIIVLGCLESCRQIDKVITTTTKRTILPTITNNNNNNNSISNSNNITTSIQQISIYTGLFFSCMLVTGMISLHTNSLSMIIVSRNVANLILMIGDYITFHITPDIYVMIIYSTLLFGAIIAAYEQHTLFVTPMGLLWMILNCFCTAGYILCMKQFFTTYMNNGSSSINNNNINMNHGTPFPISSSISPISTTKYMMFGIIFLNNLLCIIFLLPAAYATGEISLFVETTAIHTSDYATKTILAGCICFIFNYALLNCVEQSIPKYPATPQSTTITTSSCSDDHNPTIVTSPQCRTSSLWGRREKKFII